jgi:phosphopantothenoylcysteine decarboxylase
MNILLGVTGSVAAIKTQEIIDCIREEEKNDDIKLIVIFSRGSEMFTDKAQIRGADFIYSDNAEYLPGNRWSNKGDPVMHIELRKWADVLVIAPLTAHTMAKMANGLCDTLLTCIVRAWDYKRFKPILLFPAMNTAMWEHPLTRKHVETLTNVMQAVVIEPLSEKVLACGDVGPGALPPPREIARLVLSQIKLS